MEAQQRKKMNVVGAVVGTVTFVLPAMFAMKALFDMYRESHDSVPIPCKRTCRAARSVRQWRRHKVKHCVEMIANEPLESVVKDIQQWCKRAERWLGSSCTFYIYCDSVTDQQTCIQLLGPDSSIDVNSAVPKRAHGGFIFYIGQGYNVSLNKVLDDNTVFMLLREPDMSKVAKHVKGFVYLDKKKGS